MAKMKAKQTEAEFMASFPVEDVTCGVCGHGGCLLYPLPDKEEGAPQKHRPSTICPNCSTAATEDFLRFAAERNGFSLNPVTVFDLRPTGLMAQMQRFAKEADEETLKALEIAWHATPDGSNCTADFGCTETGETTYFDDGPKPSYTLAMLFDFEHFMRTGGQSALSWQDSLAAPA